MNKLHMAAPSGYFGQTTRHMTAIATELSDTIKRARTTWIVPAGDAPPPERATAGDDRDRRRPRHDRNFPLSKDFIEAPRCIMEES
jgi:hypothetical protein